MNELNMMIVELFKFCPQRLRVAQAIISHKFTIDGPGKIKCGNIRIPLQSFGNALNIDRRTVRATTEDICNNQVLYDFILQHKE